jgi:L-lactate dehydrogenase
VAGVPVSELLADGGRPVVDVQAEIEDEVKNANITIIEGIGASQYGIGVVSARLAEAVLRDEGCIFPVGSYHQRYQVTLSLPAVIGRQGVIRTLTPSASEQERDGLERSAQVLREALVSADG